MKSPGAPEPGTPLLQYKECTTLRRIKVVIVAGINKILIDQQLAELGVRATPGKMQITTPHPKMTIKNETPHMEIERQNPSFRINRKKINSQIGLRPPDELTKQFRDSGRQGALKGTKNAVDDGEFLGDLKQPGARVPRLARSKAMNAVIKKRQSNIGLMPKDKAEVEWDRGYMRINWSKHSVVIDWEGEYMPQLKVDPPYSIEVFLRTKPYFRIVVEEGESPMYPGSRVDERV